MWQRGGSAELWGGSGSGDKILCMAAAPPPFPPSAAAVAASSGDGGVFVTAGVKNLKVWDAASKRVKLGTLAGDAALHVA